MAWLAPVLKMLEAVQDMMSAITFIEFIEEESIQAAALAAFLALRNNSTQGTVIALEQMQLCVDHLREINESIGIFAPYSKGCFQDFYKASYTSIEVYRDVLLMKGKAKQQ